MEPYYLKLKKKKKSYRWLSFPAGASASILSYFLILLPMLDTRSACFGTGLFSCSDVLVFSLFIGLIVFFCTWAFIG